MSGETDQNHRFTITGHPVVLKNSKQIVSFPIKGARKCHGCGRVPSKPALIMSSAAKKGQKRYCEQLRRQWVGKAPLTGKLMLKVIFYGAWKESKRVDLSNLYGMIEDCLELVGIIADDSQVMGHDGSRIVKMCSVPNPPCPLRSVLKSGPRKGMLKDDCGAVKKCPYEQILVVLKEV